MTQVIVVKAVMEIALIVFVGFVVFAQGILSEDTARQIGNLTINITLPFMIFVSIIRNFPAITYKSWYILPFFNILLIGGALLTSYIFLKITKLRCKKEEFMLITGFQNGAFLPLALLDSLFSPKVAGIYFVYIFLFVLFFGVIIISVSRILFLKKGITIREII